MMAQGIVYTLGIIIAILLLLIFLRSVLLRRQRLAIATLPYPPQAPPPQNAGAGVVRPEPAVINPHLRVYRRPHDEQLPLYEAPPPDYDMVPKYVDLERGGAGGGDFGESSASASAAPPPGYALEGAPGAAPVNAPAAAPGRGLFRVDVRRAWSGFGR